MVPEVMFPIQPFCQLCNYVILTKEGGQRRILKFFQVILNQLSAKIEILKLVLTGFLLVLDCLQLKVRETKTWQNK